MVAAICSHSLPKEEEDLHETESVPVPSDDEEWKAVFHCLVASQNSNFRSTHVCMEATDGTDTGARHCNKLRPAIQPSKTEKVELSITRPI